jgi:replicative DNA helicase
MTLKRIDALAEEFIEDTRDRQTNPDRYRPIRTNLVDLDNLIDGITEQTYFVIGGPDKAGKSSLALHLGMCCAASGRGTVDYYCLEELQRQLAMRSLIRLTQFVDRNIIRNVNVNTAHFSELESAAKTLGGIEFYVDDAEFYAEKIIENSIKRHTAFTVIDYLQLLDTNKTKRDDYSKWDTISKMFVQARNQHGLCFIVVYQLGDSGKAYATRSIYRDADLCLEIARKIDITTERPLDNVIHINVRNSRIVKSGECDLALDGGHSRVGNCQDTISINL